jgi:hypothetical protein
MALLGTMASSCGKGKWGVKFDHEDAVQALTTRSIQFYVEPQPEPPDLSNGGGLIQKV